MTVADGGHEVEVVANNTFNLRCMAVLARPPATITWRWTGGFAPAASSPVIEPSSSGSKVFNTTGYLTINPTAAEDGRQYTCLAVNNVTQGTGVRASVTLRVVCECDLISNCIFFVRKVVSKPAKVAGK